MLDTKGIWCGLSARWLTSTVAVMLLPTMGLANQHLEYKARCFVTLAIEGGQDMLLSRDSYVIVVDNLSKNGFGSSFESLPQVLQTNYYNFAGSEDHVNVNGARPGAASTELVDRFCLEIQAALVQARNAENQQSILDAPTVTPAPFTGDSTIVNEFIISNLSNLKAKDIPLESVEIGSLVTAYSVMVDSVVESMGEFGITLEPGSAAFTGVVDTECPRNLVPASLCQRVVAEYRILLFNDDEGALRIEFMEMTSAFIQSGALQEELDKVDQSLPIKIEGIANSPTAPTFAPSLIENSFTPRPTRPLNQCYVGMITSDVGQDNQLDRTEYVSFVNFLEPGLYKGVEFEALPAPLQFNFEALATNGIIDTVGLPRPNDEQSLALQNICELTNAAITNSCCIPLPTSPPTEQPILNTLRPTVNPTQSPSSLPSRMPSMAPTPENAPSLSSSPSIIMDETEVVNQFVISNSDGITAVDLNKPENTQRIHVDNAYDTLVETIIGALMRDATRRLQIRARKLLVKYAGGSTKHYTDVDCPQGVISGSVCQEVVASFSLEVSRDENITAILVASQNAMDWSIASGNLETQLIVQGSFIAIEEGAPIINQPSGLPSLAPSLTPSTHPTTINTIFPSFQPSTPQPVTITRSSTAALSMPVIIGIAAGGAVALFVVLGGCVMMCRRRTTGRGSVNLTEEKDISYHGPRNDLHEGPLKQDSVSSGSYSSRSRSRN